MLELADIVRAAGPQVCASLAPLPSQKRALQAILACRTPALGGQLYGCDQCGALRYSYHSCGNRHCPKCHGQQTQRWLERQSARLLPCPYFLLTFTLPEELRPLARSRQKALYGLLLRAAAQSVLRLCADPRWMGAQPAITAVLHTWTRALLYHPHVHLLVSAGGWNAQQAQWRPAKNPAFLVPVRALSQIFRAKIRDGLRAAGLLADLPACVWTQAWVVHAEHAGSGEKVLGYLARYVFRIAISQSRLESLEQGQVAFRYRDNRSQQIKRVRLSAAQFLQRFLQHVLPQGLPKVRHYGLAAAPAQESLAAARGFLSAAAQTPQTAPLPQPAPPLLCPHCRQGRLCWLGRLPPHPKIPP